ncbi:hypothetical protein THERMOT_68, partial [Bathymodiolus thermophilus thioautotrophic gill symbiont]|uniref:DNA cytosine methyltransferase n=1 Tax=Bathymodiolus thermophilus thioautotrophic gill symbiont TaxID=2360 RepID=UPI00192AA96B
MLNTFQKDPRQQNFFFEGATSNAKNWVKKELKFSQNKIRLATMFSGIGAIEYALKRLKIPNEIIFASDNDKFVKESYFANYEINNTQWYDDVKDIKGKEYIDKIDLLVGGSPCQSFSMVGKRKGFQDTRGTLFYD